MEDFISDIYNFAQLIPTTKEIIKKCYENDVVHVSRMWNELHNSYVDFCTHVKEYDSNLCVQIVNNLNKAGGNCNNLCIVANTLEQTIPLMCKGISLMFGRIDITEGKYQLFSSECGYLSVYNTETNRYYHDLSDPYHEAFLYANRYYNPIFQSYKFLGCGLGYLPLNVFRQSDSSCEIYIFHNNITMVQYALNFGVLSLIPENKRHIIINENIDLLMDEYEKYTEDFGSFDVYDVFDDADDNQKVRISQSLVVSKASAFFEKQMEINFWKNIHNVSKYYTEFKDYLPNAPWIVVAAGPSLDAHLDYIKDNVGQKNIICVSTVAKKLLKYGIKPTCFAVMDPQSRTYGHFKDLDPSTNIPLIMEASGNWQFGEYYNGPKYLINNSSEVLPILYFQTLNKLSYDLGGSVTVMAICLALLYKAKTIELIGVDLAYPNGKTHASETIDFSSVSSKNLIQVPSVSGELIATEPNFLYYANQINKLINENRRTKFINFSDNGIKLDNCVWYKDLKI